MVFFQDIVQAFPMAAEIAVYREGEVSSYSAGSREFEDIIAVWSQALEGCRPMPAFGVSLNEQTVDAMKTGVWIEFVFDGTCSCEGMDFEKLAVEVRSEYGGFNVVRYNVDCGYAGRCYYIDLAGGNLSRVYDLLANKVL